MPKRLTPKRLTRYFGRLGVLGFGGPIALVGYMPRDLVEQRGWYTENESQQGLAFAELRPGPLAWSSCSQPGARLALHSR